MLAACDRLLLVEPPMMVQPMQLASIRLTSLPSNTTSKVSKVSEKQLKLIKNHGRHLLDYLIHRDKKEPTDEEREAMKKMLLKEKAKLMNDYRFWVLHIHAYAINSKSSLSSRSDHIANTTKDWRL